MRGGERVRVRVGGGADWAAGGGGGVHDGKASGPRSGSKGEGEA
jgi:hypothetical protein